MKLGIALLLGSFGKLGLPLIMFSARQSDHPAVEGKPTCREIETRRDARKQILCQGPDPWCSSFSLAISCWSHSYLSDEAGFGWDSVTMSPFLEVSSSGMGGQAPPGNQVQSKEWDLTPGPLGRTPSLISWDWLAGEAESRVVLPLVS